MATGYTYPVKDGTITEFKDFALNCAKAFGALIHMRDAKADAPITLPEESTYHKDELAKAKAEVTRLKKMTAAQKTTAAGRAFKSDKARYDRMVEDDAVVRNRYQAMLTKVEAWEAPTPDHANFKKFMAGQLTSSIVFDDYTPDVPKLQTGAAWHKAALRKAEAAVAWHTKQYADEMKRNAERVKWIQDLLGAL